VQSVEFNFTSTGLTFPSFHNFHSTHNTTPTVHDSVTPI